jgi:DNA-directed RNA polymerase specialized sigma24 family protein
MITDPRDVVRLTAQLRRILRRHLRAPDCVLDDACQAAWEALLRKDVSLSEEHVLGWLATTARREALVMLARVQSEQPLDDALDTTVSPASWAGDPQRIAVQREHLARVGELPRRQQRLVWMRGLGFGYEEISETTGDSFRTIDRQLTGARRRLSIVSEEDPAPSPTSGPGRDAA